MRGRREEPGNEASIYTRTHTCIYLYVYMYLYVYSNCLSSFHHEFRRERKPDFAEEETLKALEERETRLAKRRVADIARYAANSDRRTERRRERRAAESSE